MTYFSYHAKAKNLIKGGHLISYCIEQEYNNIKPALILFFDNHRPMPIREHKWVEYIELIENFSNKKDE